MKFDCPNCSQGYWVTRNSAYELITWVDCSCSSALADRNGEWVLVKAAAEPVVQTALPETDIRVATSSIGETKPQQPDSLLGLHPGTAAFGGEFFFDPDIADDLRSMTDSFHTDVPEPEPKTGEVMIPHNPYLGEVLLRPRAVKPRPQRRGVRAVAVAAGLVLFSGAAAAWFVQSAPNTRVAAAVNSGQPLSHAFAATSTSATTMPQVRPAPIRLDKTDAVVAESTVEPVADPMILPSKRSERKRKRNRERVNAELPEPSQPTDSLDSHIASAPDKPKVAEKKHVVTPPAAPKKRIVWDEVECKLADDPPPECARFSQPSATRPETNEGKEPLPERLSRGAINRGMAQVKAFVQGCEVRGLGRGQVVLAITVSAKGKLAKVSVKSSPNPKLGACVVDRVQGATFSASSSGGTFAFVFSFR